MRRLFVALALSACAPEAPSGPLVLSPDSETLPYAEEAAARWSAATGLEIVIGEGGTPVSFADYPIDGNPEACAVTVTTWRELDFLRAEVIIARSAGVPFSCAPLVDVMIHEIGHVLVSHGRDGIGHDPDGGHVSANGHMMSTHGSGNSCVDTESLAKVCEDAGCSAFAPEC